jgi:hypothetical protein
MKALKKLCRRIEKTARGIANPINFNVAGRSTLGVSSPNQNIRVAIANRSASVIRFANFASRDCATVRDIRMIALHITISEGAATKKRPGERHFCIVKFPRHIHSGFIQVLVLGRSSQV